MPIYEFICDNCKTYEEKELPISEHSRKQKCKRCNKEMARVFRPATAVYRGKGFYTTDKGNK